MGISVMPPECNRPVFLVLDFLLFSRDDADEAATRRQEMRDKLARLMDEAFSPWLEKPITGRLEEPTAAGPLLFGVIGEFKRGKSTLLNALTGGQLAAADSAGGDARAASDETYWDPSACRRRLRDTLRKAREKSGLSQRQASDALDLSMSRLIRIEAGTVSVSTADLRALLHLYQVNDPAEVDALTEMTRIAATGRAHRPGPRGIGPPVFFPATAVPDPWPGGPALPREIPRAWAEELCDERLPGRRTTFVLIDTPGLGDADPAAGPDRRGVPQLVFRPGCAISPASQFTWPGHAPASGWPGVVASGGEPLQRRSAGWSGPGRYLSRSLLSPRILLRLRLEDGESWYGHEYPVTEIAELAGLRRARHRYPGVILTQDRTRLARHEDTAASQLAAMPHSVLESRKAAADQMAGYVWKPGMPGSRPAPEDEPLYCEPEDGLLSCEPACQAGPGIWHVTVARRLPASRGRQPWSAQQGARDVRTCRPVILTGPGAAGDKLGAELEPWLRHVLRGPDGAVQARRESRSRPHRLPGSVTSPALGVKGLTGRGASRSLNGVPGTSPMPAGGLPWAESHGCCLSERQQPRDTMPVLACRHRHLAARSISPARHRQACGLHSQERQDFPMAGGQETIRESRAGPRRCRHAAARERSRLRGSVPGNRLAITRNQ